MGQIWALAVAPCIYYFGTSFFYQPIVDTATLTVEAEESGRALGFNDLMQAITGSVGVAIFGQLMANGRDERRLTGSHRIRSGLDLATSSWSAASSSWVRWLSFICSMKMIYSRSRVAEDES